MHTGYNSTPYAGHVVEVTFRSDYNAYDLFSNTSFRKSESEVKRARAQIYPLVVSRAFLFTNNFWTCALGLLLRPACVFHVLPQRKSSSRFPKLVRHGRIEQFQ